MRLHDLRHGAASLAHEAGADLKTLQDLLGHSSIVITADTYTSVLPLAQRRCADATAKLVLAAARRTREKIRKKGRRNCDARRVSCIAAWSAGIAESVGGTTANHGRSAPARFAHDPTARRDR